MMLLMSDGASLAGVWRVREREKREREEVA
jgi:hypothetical protein